MSRIENLLKAYEDFVAQPWPAHLSGAEKVWFAIYEPSQERRLLLRIGEFEAATRRAWHTWKYLSVAGSFAEWMASLKYRDAYFEDPDALDLALPGYTAAVASQIRDALAAADVSADTVVAVSGVGALFGLARTSAVIQEVVGAIPGRLLVFFPGSHENAQYRLLDARDGWNYLAVPITGKKGD